jgi:hypothetical protein
MCAPEQFLYPCQPTTRSSSSHTEESKQLVHRS